jgi:large subunit ribosomal protein L17
MRHRARTQTFGRKSGPRKALIRGLVYSLVEHGRIKTTLAKAKELRRHVERAVTLGKKQSLHARRLLLSRYPNENAVSTIMAELAPRFKDRAGGYTRILKLGMRPGDAAEMAFIQFVDFAPAAKTLSKDVASDQPKKKVAGKGGKKAGKVEAAEAASAKADGESAAAPTLRRKAKRALEAKRKRIRILQARARRVRTVRAKKS